MAEGIVVVPLYHRQTPGELVGMLKDCQPRLVLTGDAETSAALTLRLAGTPDVRRTRPAFADETAASAIRIVSHLAKRPDSELLTIIYTSGTSGEPKGVCLSVGNLNHMIGCTTERLDQLMGPSKKLPSEPDQIFLSAPMNFAASWMLMLSAFSRESVLTLSTDLEQTRRRNPRLRSALFPERSHTPRTRQTRRRRKYRQTSRVRFVPFTCGHERPGSASTLAAAHALDALVARCSAANSSSPK